MLEPQQRRVLLEALRPPEGYVVDHVIATTFTLDLLALLTAPLAFSLYDHLTHRDAGKGRPAEPLDSLAVLQAVREHADRLTVFCQAGRIAVPPKYRSLLTYLENSVVEVQPPSSGGVFHPKIWLLRFTGADAPIRYRLLCASRNLTFDRAWDTMLVLDGELADRTRAIGESRPLGDFIAALPGLALRKPLARKTRQTIEELADEVCRVRFEVPEGFEKLRFWPMGHDAKPVWPFADERIERLLVISPFVTADAMQRLTENGKDHVLISRVDQIDALPPHARECFAKLHVLHDAAEEVDDEDVPASASPNEPEEIAVAADGGASARGLHAKLYVADDGWNAHVWTGSANATDAAFHRNVEFMVQLTGVKSRFGVDVTLNGGKDGAGLRSILGDLTYPTGSPAIGGDAIQERLEERLRQSRDYLVRPKWVAVVTRLSQAPELYEMVLHARGDGVQLPEGMAVHAWPISLTKQHAMEIRASRPGAIARFQCSFGALTTFFAFRVDVEAEGRTASDTFVLHVPLEGAPADRPARVLQTLLSDSAKVMRFLRMLLMLDRLDLADVIGEIEDTVDAVSGAPKQARRPADPPLLESLARALDREPTRIAQVERFVREFGSVPDHAHLLPQDFHQVWEPLWAAHQSLHKKGGRT